MIEVSEAWKNTQYRFLLPESYIEIDCEITDAEAQASASASGTYDAPYSDAGSLLGGQDGAVYATNEHNLWTLNGTRKILPDAGANEHVGYVSNIASTGHVEITFPEIRTTAIAGITVVWGKGYGEYPSVFTVKAYDGTALIAETTMTDNKDTVSAVFLSVSNYDRITIDVWDWCLPGHRARIEKIAIGHILTLTKKDILSFTHEQHGDLLSGELPKYSIEFTLDNTDGRWNPHNPEGMEQYLAERQKLTVRYGLDIDGTIEWVLGGTFYLSEWNTPSNGLEARFVARDVFEFLINVDMKGYRIDTLHGLIETAVRYNLPDASKVSIDAALDEVGKIQDDGTNTAAELVQKCANAGRCIMRYGRDGYLHIEPMSKYLTDYRITSALSYSHPEITLSKPLKQVSVDYGEEYPYELKVFDSGETQSVSNDFVVSQEQAAQVAEWVRDILTSRKTVRGEFRADPILELYDVVTVESKYGVLTPVVITNIKYTFNGAFRGTYEGRVLEA